MEGNIGLKFTCILADASGWLPIAGIHDARPKADPYKHSY
jgi:hypothetical protein